jgi:carbon monoxide dehydrogenase subunit G
MSIELEHSFEVPVPPDQAWDVLLDVQRVAPCMPGATVESVNGDEVSGKIKVKVGPIALTYTGKATFTERDDATHSLKIEAAGKETRGAGTASAIVLARLNEDNGQTRVSVHTTLNVTGRPAQFGRGVMAEVSGKIIEKFSANLAGQLAGAGQPEAAVSNREVPDSRMAIPIQELNLPTRSVKSLKGEGIDTVGQLVSRSESELLSIRNLGQKSVGEIEQRLGDLGLSLAGRVQAGRAEQPGAEQEAVASATGAMPASAMAASTPAAGAADDSATSDSAAGNGAPPGRAASDSAASDSAAGNGAPPGSATADSAAWDGSRPAAWTEDEDAGLRRDEPEEVALNLFDVAAGPILKRALPVAAATILLIWVGTRIRLRGRRRASSA